MFTYCLPTEVLKTFCNSIQGGSYTSRHHQNLLQLLCGFFSNAVTTTWGSEQKLAGAK